MSGGRKGRNANHLLNFTCEDDQRRSPGMGPRRPSTAVDARDLRRAYITHNFQFALLDEAPGNKTGNAFLCDADSPPPWERVFHVTCFKPLENMTCPVCLDALAAPMVTGCGHVYCYPCVLRHIQDCKDRKAKCICPTCHFPISPKELRPVETVPIQYPIREGTVVNFTLLQRGKSSVVCVPASFGSSAPLPIAGKQDALFSRYAYATDGFVQGVLEREQQELRARLALDGGDDVAEKVVRDCMAFHPKLHGAPYCVDVMSASLDDPSEAVGSCPHYELYRSSDGQHLYLHFLCIKMLRKQYGNELPHTVEVRVMDVDTMTQNHHTRLMFKPMAHIPIHSTFDICFADMSHLVSPEVNEEFAPMIQQRQQKLREAKAREEMEAAQRMSETQSQQSQKWKDYYTAAWGPPQASPGTSPEMVPSTPPQLDAADLPALPSSLSDVMAEQQASGSCWGAGGTAAQKLQWGANPHSNGSTPDMRHRPPSNATSPCVVVASNPTPFALEEEEDSVVRENRHAIEHLFSAQTASAASATTDTDGAGAGKKKKAKRGKNISLTSGGKP